MEHIFDNYDLFQHVNVLTHKHDAILDIFITSPENPTITDVVVEHMGFPDHFMVTATISDAMPSPVITSYVARNITAMDMDAFRSRLLCIARLHRTEDEHRRVR